jgi:predicted esterase YcpF (UPF0227 family)
MKIIFLHGLESNPKTSHSAELIKNYFKDDTIIIPDYKPKNKTYEEVYQILMQEISPYLDGDEVYIIGISLGGFWAYELAKRMKDTVWGCV